ncbi:gluconolactonase [Segetibacter aerophilus]|uniref:Gluconolactonase n=2 Tax=Segetibacter aerophilus TaxID=670293 RepID=A0A512B9I4_9BACT|nr:gluconolactonase [Segetibacter aerophilus]
MSISIDGWCFQNSDTLKNNKETKIVADGATPKLISKQFSFTEGPTADKKGDIYFTDQPNDKIWKYDTEGNLSLFMDKTGRSNGMYFDKKGNLISCADERNEMWSIDPQKKVTVLMSDFKGQLLNGPNDVWVHPKGGLYFTDPLYKRPWWTRPGERIAAERVYYLPKNATQPIPVDSTIKKPNGIIGSPNGKTLYVADIGGNKTYKYKIEKDGSLSNREVFAEQGSDGMTIDKKGNIYLSGNGVTVYDKNGKKIEHIDIPEKWSANVCIGGKNKDQLFITASQAVYTVPLKVKGVGSK